MKSGTPSAGVLEHSGLGCSGTQVESHRFGSRTAGAGSSHASECARLRSIRPGDAAASSENERQIESANDADDREHGGDIRPERSLACPLVVVAVHLQAPPSTNARALLEAVRQ